nr:glycosyltransferase family 2 protein [uncultured Flavobacterium sp.]
MSFFSVVIPLYNKENFIANTLESVLNQSFTDFDVLIVDDGSTDNSLTIVKSFKDERIKIYLQENQGVSTARNKGVSFSQNTYIALLDADDIWKKNHLQSLHDAIIKFPNAGLYCTGYEISLNNKNTKRLANYKDYSPQTIEIVSDYFSSSVINPVAWPSALAFSKEKFYEMGGFNTDLKASEDLDFIARAALKYDVVINPVVTMCYMKMSENNLSKAGHNKDSEVFLSSFKKVELKNNSLKKYLDINRYSFVIRCKISNNERWRVVKKDIDKSNLNLKQRVLITFPPSVLRTLKKIQLFLVQKNIYLTAFK